MFCPPNHRPSKKTINPETMGLWEYINKTSAMVRVMVRVRSRGSPQPLDQVIPFPRWRLYSGTVDYGILSCYNSFDNRVNCNMWYMWCSYVWTYGLGTLQTFLVSARQLMFHLLPILEPQRSSCPRLLLACSTEVRCHTPSDSTRIRSLGK